MIHRTTPAMKPTLNLTIPCPKELSDHTVAALLDLLYDIACAIENHYAGQLHRYHHDDGYRHPELQDHIPDLPDPPF